MRHFLSWVIRLIELLIQGGSPSSYVTGCCEMKLRNMFLIVLLNKWNMSLTFVFWNDFSHGNHWLLFSYGQHLLFWNAILHAHMEMEKLLWDWIFQTLFGDDNFYVKKIGHLIPPPNFVEKLKLNLCSTTSLR